MGFYEERILPWLIHLAMRRHDLTPYRTRIASAATGNVLEIGIGSGLNLPFYGRSVSQVIGIDPSPHLLVMARGAACRTMTALKLIEGTAESIPIEDRSIDTVVTTWTLCSIPEVGREMRRVLRTDGHLLFVEHGRAPEPRVRWWQDRLIPMWKHLAGGCHLNRAVGELIENVRIRLVRGLGVLTHTV
jgi:ubiquinone/menaquinone biosynthesis C-methylase UbiE